MVVPALIRPNFGFLSGQTVSTALRHLDHLLTVVLAPVRVGPPTRISSRRSQGSRDHRRRVSVASAVTSSSVLAAEDAKPIIP